MDCRPIDSILTRHAEMRCQHRGVRHEFLATLLAHADVERPAGGGASILWVSRGMAKTLNLDDRLGNFAVVLGADGAVVTVAPIEDGGKGKSWRRGRN